MASPRAAIGIALALLASLGAGCALLGVRGQREAAETLARIRGEVRLEPAGDAPLVVVLAQATQAPDPADPRSGAPVIVDHYVLERAGSFIFAVTPGTFRLAAFADENANLVYDPGEPALAGLPWFELGPGGARDHVSLVISQGSSLDRTFDIAALQARTPRDQQHFSLGRFTVWGDVVDLSAPKFGAASGSLGMWRFADFIYEAGPGVYFLEPYDAAKTPVLFVHGISGYPQQFATLIERLDRKRFQPWFYFYPSGSHLERIAQHLDLVITELKRRHGFDELALVAHSMGGLVSRAFILQRAASPGGTDVRLFVAISSPWGGSESAANVEKAPENLIVYSWLDMDPASDFLKGLFQRPPDYSSPRPLPADTEFHMIFGYRRDASSFGPSSDGTVSVRSEARPEAIAAARSILPLDEDHTGILRSEATVERVNALLEQRFAPAWRLGAKPKAAASAPAAR